MGTLKYAMLGMLNRKSMTGYELTKEFGEALAEFWPAKHSQIYPELQRLTDDGLLTWQGEISGTLLEKKVYTITEKGKQDFMDWLDTAQTMPATQKDSFRLQIFFSHDLTNERRLELIADQQRQHNERLVYLKEKQKKFETTPEPDTPEFSDYLVLMGAIMRVEASCAWLEQCRVLCRNTASDAVQDEDTELL